MFESCLSFSKTHFSAVRQEIWTFRLLHWLQRQLLCQSRCPQDWLFYCSKIQLPRISVEQGCLAVVRNQGWWVVFGSFYVESFLLHGCKGYKRSPFENCLLERSWILEEHCNLFCSMPLARTCCSHPEVKQEVPGWHSHLHRAMSSPSSTKIQSVVFLRKSTSWFGDKEGKDLHNKICCSVGCSLWMSSLSNWLDDLLELHLADRNINNNSFPLSYCSSPLSTVSTPKRALPDLCCD